MAAFIHVPAGNHAPEMEPPKRKRKKFPLQGFCDFQGLKIDIENKKGSTRRGKDPDGKPWSTFMHHAYGFLRASLGVDGDGLDCYLGPNTDSPLVVVVNQQDPKTKKFDEQKCMCGFNSEDEAVAAYKKQYNSPGYYQSHITMNIGQFRRWLEDDEKRGKKIKVACPLIPAEAFGRAGGDYAYALELLRGAGYGR